MYMYFMIIGIHVYPCQQSQFIGRSISKAPCNSEATFCRLKFSYIFLFILLLFSAYQFIFGKFCACHFSFCYFLHINLNFKNFVHVTLALVILCILFYVFAVFLVSIYFWWFPVYYLFFCTIKFRLLY